ncbi:beta-alanine-activating enzyme [Pimephales promelas]|uniref:beta-alanine-activating enzyme n=1 Tax=Pimephales promelas TaxID=90988 RepID=UPI001955E587|nr:beta-alanine-activating enzyme [Pimephales promelas]KAG1964383.1 beta-alanine-activating enzyme [Pimephales promelas]
MTEKFLHELVRVAALEHGDKTAVAFDSSIAAGVSLTYDEVMSLANDLTGHLRVSVQKHDGIIGLFCHADVLMPVWIIGILQFPAAYVPLDPASPPLCTMRMMNKCRLNFCLVQNELFNQFQSAFSSLLSLEICATLSSQRLTLIKIQSEQDANIHISDQPTSSSMTKDIQQREALAYVLHTSGTTGLPKIVKVPHRCIMPNIIHLRSVFKMSAEDVVFLSSPLTFDPSVVEIFLALSTGACLLIVPSAVKKMPRRLAHVLFKRNTTTVLQATPTLVRRFGRRVLQEEVLSTNSSLRILAFGGEPFPSLNLLKSWRQAGNGTHICNLYGTTEVSCWASWYKVPGEHLCLENTTDLSVPLGEPMLDTIMEVRDETGRLVTEGDGHLFIGGQERVCLLDDEETVVKGTMRATGDWVLVRDSRLYFQGRKDRLVKRFGQRVHLDALQQVIENLPEVEACAVTLSESDRLVAFIVLASGQSGTPSSFSLEIHHEETFQHSTQSSEDLTAEEVSRNATPLSLRVIEGEIRHRLSQLLAAHSIPDLILFIPALPLTSHGKIAIDELMRMCDTQRQDINKQTVWKDNESLRLTLQTLWKECLGLPNDVVVEEDAHFMLSGGDSLQALRLCDEITVAMGTTSVGLLEVILDGSFSDVLSHVMTETHIAIQPSKKRILDYSDSVVSSKRQLKKMATVNAMESAVGSVVPSVKRTMGFVVVRRAGEIIHCGCFQKMREGNFSDESKLTVTNTSEDSHLGFLSNSSHESYKTCEKNSAIKKVTEHHEVTESLPVSESAVSGEGSRKDSLDVLPLGLRILWSSDTGRCVDASPVLLLGPDKTTVFIGSHSHRLQALDLFNGEVIWERILGDRLESSAAVSKCGSLVAVGCYDRQVYFLDVSCGETVWTFETGDVVKSSPTVDPKTGLIFAGSHDGYIYALDPLAKTCKWQHYCGGGAVFSSPCVHLSPRHLYCCTLGGNLHCLNPDSGKVLWTYSGTVPFFSSPHCSDSSVFIGSVNGHIIGISHFGDTLWDFSTKGPIFSSPCISSLTFLTNQTISTTPSRSTSPSPNHTVTCGSHDGHVYCLNGNDGSLLWQFQTTGKVFSTPFVFDGTPWGLRSLAAVCSTDGKVWVLDGETGTLMATLSLPGELFSSPVVWGHNLVVGCRNDYVYCLELTKR